MPRAGTEPAAWSSGESRLTPRREDRPSRRRLRPRGVRGKGRGGRGRGGRGHRGGGAGGLTGVGRGAVAVGAVRPDRAAVGGGAVAAGLAGGPGRVEDLVDDVRLLQAGKGFCCQPRPFGDERLGQPLLLADGEDFIEQLFCNGLRHNMTYQLTICLNCTLIDININIIH